MSSSEESIPSPRNHHYRINFGSYSTEAGSCGGSSRGTNMHMPPPPTSTTSPLARDMAARAGLAVGLVSISMRQQQSENEGLGPLHSPSSSPSPRSSSIVGGPVNARYIERHHQQLWHSFSDGP